jgi:hypothetical protein
MKKGTAATQRGHATAHSFPYSIYQNRSTWQRPIGQKLWKPSNQQQVTHG